jgi:hypothetical protein
MQPLNKIILSHQEEFTDTGSKTPSLTNLEDKSKSSFAGNFFLPLFFRRKINKLIICIPP